MGRRTVPTTGESVGYQTLPPLLVTYAAIVLYAMHWAVVFTLDSLAVVDCGELIAYLTSQWYWFGVITLGSLLVLAWAMIDLGCGKARLIPAAGGAGGANQPPRPTIRCCPANLSVLVTLLLSVLCIAMPIAWSMAEALPEGLSLLWRHSETSCNSKLMVALTVIDMTANCYGVFVFGAILLGFIYVLAEWNRIQ